MLERSNRADCKSVGYAYGGSNPSAPICFYTKQHRGGIWSGNKFTEQLADFPYYKAHSLYIPEYHASVVCQFPFVLCGSSSAGRALAFQAMCRGFDSRLPLVEVS